MQVDSYSPPPGHPLAPYLIGIFRMRARGAYVEETILPKGNADLLFNLGEPLHLEGRVYRGGAVGAAETRLAGVQTGPLVSRPGGAVDLLGVSLRAETCAALIPLPLEEVTDRGVDGALVFPDLPGLHARLAEAPAFADQVSILLPWLAARLRPRAGGEAVRHACALLRQDAGDHAVQRAAKAMAVSPRHLRRLFAAHVGVSPADYVRLARFVDALRQAAAPGPTLTAIAHAARYHDQAHFCREFRTFAGMTPRAYRSRATGVVGHLFSD